MRTQIAQKLRELRKARGWTQEQVAEKAEISVSHYASAERGAENLTVDTVTRLARAFGVRVAVLFELEEAASDDRKAVRQLLRKVVDNPSDALVHKVRVILEQLVD
jgi:transcriptional regulator with XRE-family HTH domain